MDLQPIPQGSDTFLVSEVCQQTQCPKAPVASFLCSPLQPCPCQRYNLGSWYSKLAQVQQLRRLRSHQWNEIVRNRKRSLIKDPYVTILHPTSQELPLSSAFALSPCFRYAVGMTQMQTATCLPLWLLDLDSDVLHHQPSLVFSGLPASPFLTDGTVLSALLLPLIPGSSSFAGPLLLLYDTLSMERNANDSPFSLPTRIVNSLEIVN